jgi:hypothetical protein
MHLMTMDSYVPHLTHAVYPYALSTGASSSQDIRKLMDALELTNPPEPGGLVAVIVN